MNRHLTLSGRRMLGEWIVAVVCAWCGRPFKLRDRVLAALGATISHGACPNCAERMQADPSWSGDVA